MQNPWVNISWQNTVADCDKNIIYPAYCAKKGIDISNLPEPFSGNINSHVVCLNLNPGIGKCDACFRFDKTFLKETQQTLNQDLISPKTPRQYMWFTDIRCKKGVVHDGCEWWKKKTKYLVNAIQIPLNIFVIEYFPYHSQHSISFPSLPSDDYRNDLIDDALNKGKLIVIMRGERLWYGIQDRSIGQRLKKHANLIVLSNPRNISFSQNTIGAKNWNLLINELKKPI